MFLEEYHYALCQQLSKEETLMHLLFYCPFLNACWEMLNFHFADNLSIPQIFQALRAVVKVEFALDLFILVCWGIWMVRNDVIFRNQNPLLQSCRRYVLEEVKLLLLRVKSSLAPSLNSWIIENL
jgi:hypothetical protein